MSIRVQIVMSEEERERLRRQADREGASLSRWVRDAALDRLAAAQRRELLSDPAELRAFFTRCDAREQGKEPEWVEHLETMNRSRAAAGTEP